MTDTYSTADLNRMLADELARKQRQPVRSSYFNALVPKVSAQDAAVNGPILDESQRGQPGIISKLLIGGAANAADAIGLPGVFDPSGDIRNQSWSNALKASAWIPQDTVEGIGQAITAPARAYRGEIPDEDMISEGLNFAGNMAIGGSAVPKPNNAAGMFGGRLAKTADHAKLQQAEKMAAEGAPREAIWRDTGWFQGVDGKWRFEIDDSGAAMKYPSGDVAGSVAKTMGVEGKMGDIFHHPKTYFAYPDVAAIDGDIGMLRNGTYYSAPGPGGEKISVNAHHGERVPYTLHELQHSLQEREGFAKGGSIVGLQESLQGKVPDEWLTDKNLKEAYRRMAGEVEARAVERRSSLTPLQRQERAPWLDYDVPESQQIVRFNANASESAAPGALASEAARPVKMEVPFYRGSANGQTAVDYNRPYWGTTDRNLASDYAKSRSGMYFNADTTPNVTPAVARFRDPLYIDAQNAGWSDIPFEGQKWNSDKLAEVAKERGHDGLVIDRLYDEGRFDEAAGLPATVAALRPGTVSSAFDPNNILYANSKSSGVPGALIAEAADKPRGIKAYHGSPHDFDRFDLSKIGTGEGAQAYGHGLYFAENEAVAKSYRDGLSGNHVVSGGKIIPRAGTGKYGNLSWHSQRANLSIAEDMLAEHNGNYDRSIRDLKALKAAKTKRPDDKFITETIEDLDVAIRQLEELRAKEGSEAKSPSGKMYEVSINADPNDFLDWGVPAADQRPSVRAKLPPEWQNDMVPEYPTWTGHARTPEGMQKLREAGIPGIRYLDQGSRAAGEGSSNYVVFDDALIEILRKYMNPKTAAAPGVLMVEGSKQ